MITMFSIFQVLDVEEEQASPTTSIELDVIVENNLFFKSLWPSFYINILTLSVVTRQGWTCPFFSLHDFIWQRGEGRLFFQNEGQGVHFCPPNPPGRHHHHDPHLLHDDDYHTPGQASSEESVQAMMPASSKELNTSFASIQQWSSASRRKLVIVIGMMMMVVIMTITVIIKVVTLKPR